MMACELMSSVAAPSNQLCSEAITNDSDSQSPLQRLQQKKETQEALSRQSIPITHPQRATIHEPVTQQCCSHAEPGWWDMTRRVLQLQLNRNQSDLAVLSHQPTNSEPNL